MANTFHSRTRAYVPDATTAEVDTFIYPAVYEVVLNVLARNKAKFASFAQVVTFTNKYTLPIELGVSAVRNVFLTSRPCRWVPERKYYEVQDSNSLHKATVFDPVAVVYNGVIYTLPASGNNDSNAEIIEYATQSLDNNTVSIDDFPDALEDAVTLGIAMRCLVADIAAIKNSISSITIPTLTFTAAMPTDANSDAINIPIPADLLPTGADEMDITADFSSVITDIAGYIDTDWDESLSNAKVAELNGRIQDYLTQLDGKLKKWNAEFQEYANDNTRYQLALSKYQLEINKEVSEFGADLQSASANIQKALGPMSALASAHQAYKAQMIEVVEVYSAS